MAVVRKHTDPGQKYDPRKELTNDQRQRYSDVANKAEERKEQRDYYEAATNPVKARARAAKKAIKAARARKAAQPKTKLKIKIPNTRRMAILRVLLWLAVLWAFWSWVNFMFPV